MLSENVVILENVCKSYGRSTVVNCLSLKIKRGEIFALLGPNGAGKTTTIRMLTTLATPTSGQIWVAGYETKTQSKHIKGCIGVVLQQISLDSDLTVWENMEFHGRLHHMQGQERANNIARCLDYVELLDRQYSLVRTLSGGMKRRLQIARALLHEPKILFLDEPTVGLDPQARRRLWEIVRDLKERGITILLTTHYMEEAEYLCDRVGIMDRGELIAVGSPEELQEEYGKALVVIHREGNRQIDYKFFSTFEQAQEFMDASSDRRGMMIRKSNLEDIFVELTGRTLD